jgi:hypothetical protein
MVSMRSLKVFACLVAATAATLVCQQSSIASSVGVNYDAGSFGLLPAESAGVVPQQNWNNVAAGNPAEPVVTANLVKDTAGVASPSGIKLTTSFAPASQIAGSTVSNVGGAPVNTGDRKMMETYADVLDFGVETSIKLENLAAYGPFDVLLYSAGTWNPPDPDRIAQYRFFNGTTTADPLLVTRLIRNKVNGFNVPADAYKESIGNGTIAGTVEGNYIRVSFPSPPTSGSLFISAKALQGSPARGAINGFQLVQTPEPGTITLLVMGFIAGGTLFRRR